jgi:hypothetical protein
VRGARSWRVSAAAGPGGRTDSEPARSWRRMPAAIMASARGQQGGSGGGQDDQHGFHAAQDARGDPDAMTALRDDPGTS